jgi:hypothetical protein
MKQVVLGQCDACERYAWDRLYPFPLPLIPSMGPTFPFNPCIPIGEMFLAAYCAKYNYTVNAKTRFQEKNGTSVSPKTK